MATYNISSTSVDEDVPVDEDTTTDKQSKQTKKITFRIPKELQIRSISIKDGDPQIYQLQIHETYRSPSDSVVRYVVGSSSVPLDPLTMSSERVLMLVGATGTGKTTLVNGIANYIYGTEWKHNYRLKVIDKEGSCSQAFSQTKEINAYTFPVQEGSPLPYTLTVIDTPGFGDSAGVEHDQSIVKQIQSFFSLGPPDGIKFLHGIGFVVKASDNRLTPAQSYIFNSILHIFGKDIENNIFVIITFFDAAQKPLVLKALKEAKIPCKGKGFKFNNSALFADKYVCDSKSLGDSDEDDDVKDADTINSLNFEQGMRSFERFFNFFKKAEQRTLQQTKEVFEERKRLEHLIEQLRREIVIGMGKLSELQQEEKVLSRHEADIEANKNFTYTVEVVKYVGAPTESNDNVTNCIACGCTCHYPCKCDKDKNNCGVMKKKHCTVCPGRCHFSKHTNAIFHYKAVKLNEDRTYENLKTRYDDATSKLSHTKTLLRGLETELSQLRENVLKLAKEAHETMKHLNEIALRPDPLSEADYIKQCIEKEKQEGKPGWEERIHHFEEMLSQDNYIAAVRELPYANIEGTESEHTDILDDFSKNVDEISQRSPSLHNVLTLPHRHGPDRNGQSETTL